MPMRLRGGDRKYCIAGNWKMNPTTLEEAKKLAADVQSLPDPAPCTVRIFMSLCSPTRDVRCAELLVSRIRVASCLAFCHVGSSGRSRRQAHSFCARLQAFRQTLCARMDSRAAVGMATHECLLAQVVASAAKSERDLDVLVCCPYPFLAPVADVCKGSKVKVGAEVRHNMYPHACLPSCMYARKERACMHACMSMCAITYLLGVVSVPGVPPSHSAVSHSACVRTYAHT